MHEKGKDELQDLWASYKATGEERAREGLILHYSPLVKFVAGRVGAGLPKNVDQSDLISFGTFGLQSELWAILSDGGKAWDRSRRVSEQDWQQILDSEVPIRVDFLRQGQVLGVRFV